MTVAYGAVYPAAYKIGTEQVDKIYLGTEQVWPGVGTAILSPRVGGGYSSWDSGNDGLTEATAYRKASFNTLGTYGTQTQLRMDIVASGKIHIKWSAAYSGNDPNYGEVGLWRNLTPFAVSGPYATVEWAGGSTGSAGEIVQTVNAGEYFIFNIYDFASWSDLRVWGLAYDSAEDAPLRLTSLPPRPTIASSGTATLTVVAAATGSLAKSYYWHKRNTTSGYTLINNNESGTLSLTGLTYPADAYGYYFCVANTFPNYGSDFHINCPEIQVIVIDPSPSMSIVTQPTDQTASGGTASFSVAATSTSPLHYVWYRAEPGADVFSPSPGTATFETLNLSGLTYAADNGSRYYCMVYYAGTGTAPAPLQSNTVTLTVPGSGSTNPFYAPNPMWQALGFSGDGSQGNRFTKARLSNGPPLEAKIRVANSGFVSIYIESVWYDSSFFYVSKNSSPVISIGSYAGSAFVSHGYTTFAVNAGDTIGLLSTGFTDVQRIEMFFQTVAS